jgi:rare lipoprotein A
MPIFGLVWVASWVGCFFSSSQEMLQAPSYSACALSVQSSNHPDPSLNQPIALTVKLQPVVNFSSLPQQGQQPQVAEGLTRYIPNKPAQISTHKGFLPAKPFSSVPLSSVKGSAKTTQVQSPFEAGKFFITLRSLLSGVQASFITPPSPQVEVAPVTAKRETSVQSKDAKRISLDRCSLMPDSGKPLTAGNQEHFQVKFKGHVVGEVLDQQEAQLIAKQLEQWLADSTLKQSHLQPGLVDGMPAVKLGDRTLFSLNHKLVQNENCNLEMLAIQWTNNLRTALAEPPLTLVEAQEKIYQLEATENMIKGLASWYGPYFHGRQTATGEVFDQNGFTAAHPSLPFDTYLKVTNQLNDKSVIVRVNDRGPYIDDRALDLSREAARYLDSEVTGVIPIEAIIMKSNPGQAPQTVANAKL